MSKNCVNRLNKILQTLDNKNISTVAYNAYKDNTPIGDPNRWKSRRAPKNYKPGNARRKTKLQGNEIQADYPYAKRLEEGWSTQAPDGMTKPTIEEIRAYVYNTLGIKI
jgi:hypothetical protein